MRTSLKENLFALFLFFIRFRLFAQLIRLDTSFNHIGFNTIILPPANESAGEVIIVNPTDSKYTVNADHNPGYSYLRYNRNGSPDTSFNHVGYTEENANAMNFYLDGNNKLVSLFGSAIFSFFRVNQNGSPDSTFGINGAYISETY